MDINFEQIIEQITQLSAQYGFKLVAAIISLWIGWKIVNVLCKALEKWFDKVDYDQALETFILSLA